MSQVARFELCMQLHSARPFLWERSPGGAPDPGCLQAWCSDAGTSKGVVTKAARSQLTPEQ